MSDNAPQSDAESQRLEQGDALAPLVLQFDDALAEQGPTAPAITAPAGLSADQARQLKRTEHCLRLLERLFPRNSSSRIVLQPSDASALTQSVEWSNSGISASSMQELLDRLVSSGELLDSEVKELLSQCSTHDEPRQILNAARKLVEHGRARLRRSRRLRRSTVLGKFLIVAELGHGGMGTIYKAVDTQRNCEVALKILHHRGPRAIARIKHEFRCLQNVAHPNLVLLDELVAVNGEWFFTMELIDGQDFVRHVRDGGNVNVDRLRRCLIQLAGALSALHSAGILHCDLKPSNVLVTGNERVVLLDFGLTREIQPGTRAAHSEAMAGTLNYMSPEQASNRFLTPASDSYSLGVILFESLTGNRPSTDMLAECLSRTSESLPERWSRLFPGISTDLVELCRALLRHEPEERPLAIEVWRRLSSSGHPEIRNRPEFRHTQLFGRRDELTTLEEAYWTTRQGRPVCVEIQGPSGIGKTTLVDRFLDKLALETEATILRGRCYERESVPYKALDAVMDELAERLRRLSPEQLEQMLPADFDAVLYVWPALARTKSGGTPKRSALAVADEHSLRRRAFVALRELFANLARWRPLVLWIDDLQWGDLDSAMMLADILQPPEAPALLLLASYRQQDREQSPFLQALTRILTEQDEELGQKQILLDPLPTEVASQMATALLPIQDSPVSLERIVQQSAGNPYLLSELARHCQTSLEGSADLESGAATFEAIVWHRIKELDSQARSLLEVIAIAGGPVPRQVAIEAADVGIDSLSALSILRAENLVRTAGLHGDSIIETYHDRIRETLVARLSLESARACHLNLAKVGEASARLDAESLAGHFSSGGEVGRGAVYAELAAERAAEALAFDRAAAWYRQALAARSAKNSSEAQLRKRLADSLVNAGHRVNAAQEYQKAVATAELDRSHTLALKQRAAVCLLTSGYVDQGVELLTEVLRMVGLRIAASPQQASRLLLWHTIWLRLSWFKFKVIPRNQIPDADLQRIELAWQTCVSLAGFDFIRALEFYSRTFRMAIRMGDAESIGKMLVAQAGTSAMFGSIEKRNLNARYLRQARHLLRQGRQEVKVYLTLAACQRHFFGGRWRASNRACKRAEVLATKCVDVWYEITTAQQAAIPSLFLCGEVAEMRRRVSYLLKVAVDHGDIYAATNMRTACNVVWLAADNPIRARAEVSRGMQEWSFRGVHLQHFFELMAHVQIDLYSRDGTAAWARMSASWKRLSKSFLPRIQFIRSMLHYLRAASALRAMNVRINSTELERAVQESRRSLNREHVRWPKPVVLLIDAGLAAASGNRSGALSHLELAAEGFASCDMPLHAAAADRRRGELLENDEGNALIATADRWMWQQEVVNPPKMTDLLVPVYLRT